MSKSTHKHQSKIVILAIFLMLLATSLLNSCDSLFHDDSDYPYINQGEVGDKETYLTHFPNQECNFKLAKFHYKKELPRRYLESFLIIRR